MQLMERSAVTAAPGAASPSPGTAVLAGLAWSVWFPGAVDVQAAVTAQTATTAHAAACVRHRLLPRCTPRL